MIGSGVRFRPSQVFAGPNHHIAGGVGTALGVPISLVIVKLGSGAAPATNVSQINAQETRNSECLTGHERFPLAPEHESRFAVKREGARGPEVDVRLGLDPDA